MALAQQYSGAESEDGDIIYIDDDTGEYDAVSNTGGYGTPNTARNAVALIEITKYKAVSGDVELTAESYDPETVTQFEYRDRGEAQYEGHYEANIYSVPIKTGAETPSENDFVYDATGNQLQRWNGAAWVSATKSELEDNDWDHITVDFPHLPNLWLAFNNVNKLLLIGCRSVTRSDLQQDLATLSSILNGTISLFAEESYSTAQRVIEKYISRAVYLRDLTS